MTLYNATKALEALQLMGLYDYQAKTPKSPLFWAAKAPFDRNETSLNTICSAIKECGEPRNVYLVPARVPNITRKPNKSGISVISRETDDLKDAEWLAIIAEHDTVSKEESQRIVAESVLPPPSFQIDSGGKSIHHWWLLSKPITQQQFVDAQTRLAQLLGSDPEINKPTQVVRLPGFAHAKTGRMAEIIHIEKDMFDQPVTYHFEDLEALLPELAPPPEHRLPLPTTVAAKPQRAAKNEWFTLLSESGQDWAAADMLGYVWQATAGDFPESHETRRKMVAGLVGHYRSPKKVEELWQRAQKDFGVSWDKTTKASMIQWATELIQGQKKREGGNGHHPSKNSIGTCIAVAKKLGWNPAKFKALVANDDGHLSKMVCSEMFDGGDGWLTYVGQCYEKVGTHYEHRDDIDLLKAIADHLEENYPTKSATNFAQGVLTWLKVKTGATSRPNPDGYINCTNGILEVKPGGHRRLISHDDPESLNYIFFDAPKFAYDPDADRTEALRLLECLPDPEGRALFMRSMAFAINWEEAARTHGHAIAVFSRGEGSNGKDTNIIMLKRIFGDSAVTGIQLTEFSKADKSTSFALVELAKARLNLPSETNCQLKIDNLKTLKAVTSGNEIWVERKGEQGYSFAPKVVQMYPTNNEFILTNAREADERRYMGLDWPYSYTTNQHKLKTRPDQFRLADRRFLGHGKDNQWVCEKVVPGYFNILLEYFEDVCAKGFDDLMGYSREVLKKMYGSLNHLPDFIEEVGLYMDTQGPKYHEKSLSPDDLFTKYYQPWCAECGRARKLGDSAGSLYGSMQGDYQMITPESCSDKTWKSGLDLGKALTTMGFATGRINQAQADKLGLKRGLYFQFIHIKEGVF